MAAILAFAGLFELIVLDCSPSVYDLTGGVAGRGQEWRGESREARLGVGARSQCLYNHLSTSDIAVVKTWAPRKVEFL